MSTPLFSELPFIKKKPSEGLIAGTGKDNGAASVTDEHKKAEIVKKPEFKVVDIIAPSSVEEDYSKLVDSTLGSLSITAREASLQMVDAFNSTLPIGADFLQLNHNMDTTSLATTFTFTTSELTENEGIIYGINEHNGSLIIFDRFTLENANSVIFAKSGSGKSYFVKLEALRSMMFGTQVI